ncbi:M28 family peptidase [Kordiimonas pumila]|uniref:M28 family peptidase n=1 Tax=Kordiimonas pumila TaxID=2161677 RepID=A0ABV7D1N8_9PROT|nr:M28 family peptidase [Kordiimonas pumila]
MFLRCNEILKILSEWPVRTSGSEDEMLARESMVTLLESQTDVTIVEEAFWCPVSNQALLGMISIGVVLTLWVSSYMPYIALLSGLFFWISYLLHLDGRAHPLVWVLPKKLTANISASKGAGQGLYILMAHLDTKKCLLWDQQENDIYRKYVNYLTIAVIASCVLVPILNIIGYNLSFFGLAFLSAIVLCRLCAEFIPVLQAKEENNDLGVAAATVAASKFWHTLPKNAEVRLLITTGHEQAFSGVAHYIRQHKENWHFKSVFVINFDALTTNNLGYNLRSGTLTPVLYSNVLSKLVAEIPYQDHRFVTVKPQTKSFVNFETVYFYRASIPSLTLTSETASGNSISEEMAAEKAVVLTEKLVAKIDIN